MLSNKVDTPANASNEAQYLEKLASNNDSKGLQTELASISRTGNQDFFQSLYRDLNAYQNDSAAHLPALTLHDEGQSVSGNEKLGLTVKQPGASGAAVIQTDGDKTTYTPAPEKYQMGGIAGTDPMGM